MTPDAYCADKAARSGSSFYYSFRLLDAPRRTAITALYAYCREVDDVVDEVADPAVARVKLAWWRTEVDRIFAGTPQHPVAVALVPVVRRYALQQSQLQLVIDGMQMDLDKTRYVDFDELETYCDRVAGVVGRMSAEIFGYRNEATRLYARDLGVAFQLTNILRDIREDLGNGRVYLPAEDLERFGCDLAAPDDRIVDLVRFEADRAQAWFESGLKLVPLLDRQSAACVGAMAGIYRRLLARIERRPDLVLRGRVSVPTWEKGWVAVRSLAAVDR
jgi:15-cis-phytoene synthase